jgi:hypothetical protein
MTPGVLWNATRDLHHACEAHPVGAAMASGTPPAAWYADWLMALRQLHAVVDTALPAALGRVERLDADLLAGGLFAHPSRAAANYAATLTTEPTLAAAAYVLTGAHLMGGEIMRRRLAGFPTSHLEWDDRKDGLAWLKPVRERADIAQEARDCFAALLAIMDEIAARHSQ